MIEDRIKWTVRITFFAMVILAILLRGYHLGWGLPNGTHPYSYHPDEARIVQYMGAIHPENLDFNPDDFAYPTFHVLLSGAVMLVLSKIGYITVAADPMYYAAHPDAFARILLIGRIITLLFSIGSLIVLYHLGKQLYNRRAALLVMFLFAINPLDVMESHYFTLDVPMTFWILASVLCAVMLSKNGKNMWYLLSGLFLGFAAATKYPGLIALVPLLICHVFWINKDRKPGFSKFISAFFTKGLAIAAVACIVGFVIGVPYAVLEPSAFFGAFSKTFQVSSGAGVPTPSGYNVNIASWLSSWNTYPYLYQLSASLPFSLGIPIYCFFVLSVILMVRYGDRRSTLVLLLFIGSYLLVVGRWIIVFPRYLHPIIPFALLSCAIGYRIIKKQNHNIVPALCLTLICLYTLAFTVSMDLKFNDTIDDGFSWVYEHVPKGSTIATTMWAPLRYTPLQDPDAFKDGVLQNEVVLAKRLNDLDHDDRTYVDLCGTSGCNRYTVLTMFNPTDEWFTKYSPDYVILSSLATTGTDTPPPHNDKTADNERDYYTRFYTCNSVYAHEQVFDRPYFTESWYTALDPRFKSMYASPRIEILKRMGI